MKIVLLIINIIRSMLWISVPLGALTSKDFRFQQRVWFLKDFDDCLQWL